MASHVLVADPNELSTRYSKRSGMGSPDSVEDILDGVEEEEDDFEERAAGRALDLGAIDRFLDRIPAREADFIRLYHRDKLKQEQIAKLFGITQAAVSYRLHRGIKRIQFLRTIPELTQLEFDKEVGPMFESQDKEILWRMYNTTCQSEIAKQLGLTQARVRHRFFRSLEKVRSVIQEDLGVNADFIEKTICYGKTSSKYTNDEGIVKNITSEELKRIKSHYLSKYYVAYTAISDKHFCILHEVKIPQFSDRGDAVILPID